MKMSPLFLPFMVFTSVFICGCPGELSDLIEEVAEDPETGPVEELDSEPILVRVSGSVFWPAFSFHAEAAISIEWSDGSEPLLQNVSAGDWLPERHSFIGASSEHVVEIRVLPASALKTVNFGFRGGDGGNFNLVESDIESIAFHPSDSVWNEGAGGDQERMRSLVGTVMAVEGLPVAPNLEYFCCEWQALEEIDLSGCSELRSIEAYYSQIKTTGFADCRELRRCCLESTGARGNLRYGVQTDLDILDLRDCPQLRDIRGTNDDHEVLWLHPEALSRIWHLCKMNNGRLTALRVGQEPAAPCDFSRFTALRECWITGSPITGNMVVRNGVMDDLSASGCGISSFDSKDQRQLSSINLSNNALVSIDISGCTGLRGISFYACCLDQSQVDGILSVIEGFGTVGGEYHQLRLDGEGNAPPSASGFDRIAALEGRGWSVSANVEQGVVGI